MRHSISLSERKESVDLIINATLLKNLKHYVKNSNKSVKNVIPKNIVALEAAIYNKHINWSEKYKDLVGRIARTISAQGNSFILSELIKPSFDPLEFLNLGEMGWNPSAAEPILREIEAGEKKREISAFVVPSKDMKCRQCGCNKILVQTKQTRASDEDSTAFYVCTNCGNQWRKTEGL